MNSLPLISKSKNKNNLESKWEQEVDQAPIYLQSKMASLFSAKKLLNDIMRKDFLNLEFSCYSNIKLL